MPGDAVFLSVTARPTVYAQSDTTVGTWKVNLAKSKYEPGPPPVSESRMYESFGTNGIKGTFNRVNAGGEKVTITYSAAYDGKDYTYVGSPDADAIVVKKVDANATEATLKKNGKVMQTTRAVVSRDGKTRTHTTTGTNAKGQKIKRPVRAALDRPRPRRQTGGRTSVWLGTVRGESGSLSVSA